MTTLPLPDAKDRVSLHLQATGHAGRGVRVVPLTGDASDRKYFRILPTAGDPFVLAVHATTIEVAALPFVNVAKLLDEMALPIPRILGHDGALGIIELEDLGDVTLQAHLGSEPFSAHAALYRQAVSHIATMQKRGAELSSPAYVPYGVAFDVEKLTWELDFFLKHYVAAYRNAVLPQPAYDAVREECRSIVEELAAEPRVLCHRDYHSRNLMLHRGKVYLIDFQDARMGPDTYDLASLLRDSYVDLNDIAVNELIAYFLAIRGGDTTEADFRPRFDLMALQRNMKALGTFGYQTTARRNPVYIQYMPRTLRYIRDTLRRYPRFGRLQEILSAHIDELR